MLPHAPAAPYNPTSPLPAHTTISDFAFLIPRGLAGWLAFSSRSFHSFATCYVFAGRLWQF